VITAAFHYDFSTSCAHCHFTTLWVKHWSSTWVANQIVIEILWYLSFLTRIWILKVPDIDYIFSKDLPLSNKRQLSFRQETRGKCWWHSIRLLSSQHYNSNHSSLLETELNWKNIMKSCYWRRICEQSSLMKREPNWKNIMKSCYWGRIYDQSSLMEKESNWKK